MGQEKEKKRHPDYIPIDKDFPPSVLHLEMRRLTQLLD